MHHVQNARKQINLAYTDRIKLRLDCSEDLAAVARAHEAYIASETLTTEVQTSGFRIDPDRSFEAKIEGETVRFDIEKAD